MTTVENTLTEAYWPADTTVPLSDHTVGALLADRAARYCDRLALVGTAHGTGEQRRFTYAELYDEALRVAVKFTELAKPGDFVAIWAPNVVEWPIIEYGAALAGVVLVTVNPAFRPSELQYVLRHSGATVLVHADALRDYDMAHVAREVGAKVSTVQHIISLADRDRWQAASADGFESPATDPDALAMLQYTSGTTGNPKGVLLRHRSLVNVAKMTVEAAEIPEGAVCVGPLPMFHTAGCVISTLGPAWRGGVLLLVETFIPTAVLDLATAEHADVLFYVPAVLGALLEAGRGKEGVAPQFPTILGGAATVPPVMIEAASTVFGGTVHNLFGQTELAPVLTMIRKSDAIADQLQTIGRPIPQVECRIARGDGSTAALGEEGEICARGYQQMIAYKDDPAATAGAVDADGWLHTGDLGSMDARGYLTLTGRLKDLIITGGENVAPAEIESRLLEHDSVLAANVIGLPDARWGEAVSAVVVTRGERPDDLVAQLEEHLSSRVAPFKLPKRWFVADALPMTASGKVQKFKLHAAIESGELVEVR
jgi:fatty-acyl-CoA synthase